MTSSTHRSGKGNKPNHKNTPLSLEKLEDRMMFALGSLQEQLQLLTSSGLILGPTQHVAASTVNAAPTVANGIQSSVSTEVRAKSSVLSILGSDDRGETNLSYQWKLISSSTGGAISFSLNGKNAAKQTVATFSKAGVYTLSATITDQGGLSTTQNITLNVSPTLTSLSVRSADKAVSGTVSVAGTSQAFSVVALDQFGNTMTLPTLDWSTMSAPKGATPSITQGADRATIAFSQVGSYTIKVAAGSVSSNVSLNVVPTLTSVSVSANGATLNSGDSIDVATASQKVTVQGFDQFGAKLVSNPTWAWSATANKSGASATFTTTNGTTSIAFNRAANYAIKVQSGKIAFSFSAAVSQTFSKIAVALPGTTIASNSLSVSVNGTSQRFLVTAQDQFGVAMSSQPDFRWDSATTPTDGSATINNGREGATIGFNKSGTYTFRVASGNVTSSVSVNVVSTLSRIALVKSTNDEVTAGSKIDTTASSLKLKVVGYDQFGNTMTQTPVLTWTTTSTTKNANATVGLAGNVATLTFNRAANYAIKAQSGSISLSFSVNVGAVFSKINLSTSDGKSLATGTSVNVSGTSLNVSLLGVDQFGNALTSQPNFDWTNLTSPSESSATTVAGRDYTSIAFNKSGSYGFQIRSGELSVSLNVNVVATATSLALTPGTASINPGVSVPLTVQAIDQFKNVLTNSPIYTWTATGGTISSSGVYTAPSAAGSYTVTVKLGTLSATAKITVGNPVPSNGLQNPSLSSLVASLGADGSISRADVIAILRSTGNDGVVDGSELNDLKYLLNNATQYNIASYVQILAGDVVNGNLANATYLGTAAGNLVAGSSSTLLNNLVNKWFLGTDAPVISSSSLSYVNATGPLFVNDPSHNDEHQGMLGDCYFISSLGTIADRNPTAIRNMFLDNGDGTFTVRFYANGTADYVTVDRRLPAFSNGVLGYSGYGFNANSSTNPLWIALAEKAYAQWNATGKEGRNNTNTYSGIEGGWMAYVDAQVLGKSAASYSVGTGNKQLMIDALNTSKAVTIGTNSSVGSGLVGSHAYAVIGYNASSDTFTLYNPWGTNQPGALSWSQLVSNCSAFVIADASGSSAFGVSSLRSEVIDTFQTMVTMETRASGMSSDVSRNSDGAQASDLGTSLIGDSGTILSLSSDIQRNTETITIDPQDDSGDTADSIQRIEDRIDAIFSSLELNDLFHA